MDNLIVLVGFGLAVLCLWKQDVFLATICSSQMCGASSNGRERDSVLFYSMWSGYRETEPVKKLLAFCAAREIEVVPLHCSGHAYAKAIKVLIWRLNPAVLIPIHCEKESRERFLEMHPHCEMLIDGKHFEVD